MKYEINGKNKDANKIVAFFKSQDFKGKQKKQKDKSEKTILKTGYVFLDLIPIPGQHYKAEIRSHSEGDGDVFSRIAIKRTSYVILSGTKGGYINELKRDLEKLITSL